VFAPNVGDKNARTSLIEYATNHGWLLDLTAVRSRHLWRPGFDEQDPNQFLRAAEFGGHWLVNLDYEVKGDPDDYRSEREWDNTLRSLTVWHSSWVNSSGDRTRAYQLRNYHQSNSSRSMLWDITDTADGKFKPLRKRAEEILRNPSLAIWTVEEQRYTDRQAEANRRREWEERSTRRRQPLAVTVSQDDYRELARRLRATASDLVNADGLTDLPAEVAKAESLILWIRSILKDPGKTAQDPSV
jgi:hypothetical protein